MAGPYQGWESLGAALAGGDRGAQSNAYDDQFSRRARREKLLADAQQARLKSIAQAGMPQALGALGLDNPEALTTLIQAGAGNFPQMMQGQETQQKMGLRDQAMSLGGLSGEAANVPMMNNAIAIMAGKLLPQMTTQGGGKVAIRDQYGTPELLTTELGMADIGADQALVRQREAAAQRYARPPAARGGGGREASPEDVALKRAKTLKILEELRAAVLNRDQSADVSGYDTAIGELMAPQGTFADVPGMIATDAASQGLQVPPIEQITAMLGDGSQPFDLQLSDLEAPPAAQLDENASLANARAALAAGAPRDAVIRRLQEAGLGHLADQL